MSRELLEGTIRDIRDSIGALQKQREVIDAQIREKQARLAEWEARFVKATSPARVSARQRNPKGENLRRLLDLLRSESSGVPVAAASSRTGVPPSSVRAIIKRNPELLEERSGLLSLKPGAASNAH